MIRDLNFNYYEIFFRKQITKGKKQERAIPDQRESIVNTQLPKPIAASANALEVSSLISNAIEEENPNLSELDVNLDDHFVPPTYEENELMRKVRSEPHKSISQIEELKSEDEAESSAELRLVEEILALSQEPDCSDKVVSAFLTEIRKTFTTACLTRKLECLEHLDKIYKLSLHISQLESQVDDEKKSLSKFRPPKQKKSPSLNLEEITALSVEAEAIALRQSRLYINELYIQLSKLQEDIIGKQDFNSLTRNILSSAPQHLLKIQKVKSSLASIVRESTTSAVNAIKKHCTALDDKKMKAISKKERINQLNAEKDAVLQEQATPIQQVHLEKTINEILDIRLASYKPDPLPASLPAFLRPLPQQQQQQKNANRQFAAPGNTVKQAKGSHHPKQHIVVVQGPDLRFSQQHKPNFIPMKVAPPLPVTPRPPSPSPRPPSPSPFPRRTIIQQPLPPPTREATPTPSTQKDKDAVQGNNGVRYSLRPRISAQRRHEKEHVNP